MPKVEILSKTGYVASASTTLLRLLVFRPMFKIRKCKIDSLDWVASCNVIVSNQCRSNAIGITAVCVAKTGIEDYKMSQ